MFGDNWILEGRVGSLIPVLTLLSLILGLFLLLKWRRADRTIGELRSHAESLRAAVTRWRDTHDTLKDAIHAAPVGIWVADREGNVSVWNDSAGRIFDWSEQDARSRPLPGASNPDPSELAALDPEKRRFEVTHLKADGSAVDVQVWMEPLADKNGDPLGSVGVALDVSDVKKTQRQLMAREERYRELVENAYDLIYSIDLQGNFTSINKAGERISGYSLAEALSMNIAQLVAPECLDLARQMIQRTLRGESSTSYELEIVTKTGGRAVIEVSNRLLLQNGVPIGTHGIARDITERKRSEQLEQDRLRVLEMMATHQPLEDILEELMRKVEHQYPDMIPVVNLLKRNRLYPCAASRLPATFVERLEGIGTGPGMGSCAVVVQTGRSYCSENISGDPVWRSLAEVANRASLKACWSFPILAASGGIIGTLASYLREPAIPDLARQRLLQAAAGLAAIAIEQRQLTDQLAHQALHDSLTQLPNRALFQERLHHALAYARRYNHMVALLYVDLDRFKLINDTLGHGMGDRLLQQVARRLRRCIRESDTMARMSGDEFTIIACGLRQVADADTVAGSVLDALRQPFVVEGRELFITASVGISLYPRDASDAETLQRHADIAMYRAKGAGKNACQYFAPEMGAAVAERHEVENLLRRAIERSEFRVHYQPQFNLGSGAMCGHEALLRWNSPKLGPVAPARFIPIAEESGLIVPIGSWVIEEACRQIRTWQQAGHLVRNLAVNVSALQFAQPNFTDTIESVLNRTELPPQCLELELTETMIMKDVDDSVVKMSRLRALGVRISVDDFGTGYSSLSYLQRLPIDVLKIDRSFVQQFDKSIAANSLVHAIVMLAHGLNIRVTAEGIETQEQYQAMREVGCDQAQGFLLGRPEPPDTIFSGAHPSDAASTLGH